MDCDIILFTTMMRMSRCLYGLAPPRLEDSACPQPATALTITIVVIIIIIIFLFVIVAI